jgi:hypothetical protein
VALGPSRSFCELTASVRDEQVRAHYSLLESFVDREPLNSAPARLALKVS